MPIFVQIYPIHKKMHVNNLSIDKSSTK